MIPKTFQLAGVKWKVVPNPHLVNLGECHSQKGLVYLKNNAVDSQQTKEQVFCHELVHSILFTMGDGGPHDEKFVDGFAYLLHQYLVTAK